MQQKVAIARALLTSPTLLLLDEPTTGLDPRSKLDVQSFIEELQETHDTSIVLTTHDLAEAERLCNRITILDGGRVVAEDTPDGLIASEGNLQDQRVISTSAVRRVGNTLILQGRVYSPPTS